MNNNLKSLLFEEVWSGSKKIRIMESDFYMDKCHWVYKYVPKQSEQDEFLYRLARIAKDFILANGKGDFKKHKQNMSEFWKDLDCFRRRYQEAI